MRRQTLYNLEELVYVRSWQVFMNILLEVIPSIEVRTVRSFLVCMHNFGRWDATVPLLIHGWSLFILPWRKYRGLTNVLVFLLFRWIKLFFSFLFLEIIFFKHARPLRFWDIQFSSQHFNFKRGTPLSLFWILRYFLVYV